LAGVRCFRSGRPLASALAHYHRPAGLSVAIFRRPPEYELRLPLFAFEPPSSFGAADLWVRALLDFAADEDLADFTSLWISMNIGDGVLSAAVLAARLMVIIGMIRNAMMKR
jgi:hypothetical protein